MAVAGVLTVADVGDHQQLRYLAFDCPHGPLDNTVVVIRAGGEFILRFRQAKDHDAANAKRRDQPAFLHRDINRHLRLRRHRTDWPPNSFSRAYENGQDEVVRTEFRLSYQAANCLAGTEAAGAVNRERHLSRSYLYRC